MNCQGHTGRHPDRVVASDNHDPLGLPPRLCGGPSERCGYVAAAPVDAIYGVVGEDTPQSDCLRAAVVRWASPGLPWTRPTPTVLKSVHDLFPVGLHGRGQIAAAARRFCVRGGPLTFATVRATTWRHHRRDHPQAGFAVRPRSPPSGERWRWGTRWGADTRRTTPDLSEMAFDLRKRGGRCWDRTSDLFRARYPRRVRRVPSVTSLRRSARCAAAHDQRRSSAESAGLLHPLLHGRPTVTGVGPGRSCKDGA